MRRFLPYVLLLLCCCGCFRNAQYYVVSGQAQGGTYSVKFSCDSLPAEQVKASCDSILLAVDTTFSIYNSSSLTSRLNRGDISLDGALENPLFRDLYNRSILIKEETASAVDITAGALFQKFGFGSPEASGGGICLNFNAVAQGYSCDLIASWLKSRGCTSMLVDVGGEIYCCGMNPSASSWTIGIDAPKDGNNTPGAILQGRFRVPAQGRGVVTSGNYRKFYYRDGKKISHTIDPRTGESVSHSLLSATIVLDSDDFPAMKADAYATYCMVVGLDSARDFVLSRPGMEACLVYAADTLMASWTSPGLALE
ncbi:MAG: FAD:protein FMN transferase [Bacteroidales bacterium]|nr:FAD:protein FMN transferase [Bacteroidales bacterium]